MPQIEADFDFINSFADEDGITIRAPFSPTWPPAVLSVMTFAEHEGKTSITVQSVPFNATEKDNIGAADQTSTIAGSPALEGSI
jgi:hypothetical protein